MTYKGYDSFYSYILVTIYYYYYYCIKSDIQCSNKWSNTYAVGDDERLTIECDNDYTLLSCGLLSNSVEWDGAYPDPDNLDRCIIQDGAGESGTTGMARCWYEINICFYIFI